ncbi:MAG TPA: HAMP domain-containing sensor histidine kinase [Longimicrobiales bacterium]|nr:HAMP domain-containing sensor histidine kinase [Longimicrobiales bacterium]
MIDPVAAAADRPAELRQLLQEISRLPAESFTLQSTLIRLLNLAAASAGARSAYFKRLQGEPGRPAIVACSEGEHVALEGTVASQTFPVVSLGAQIGAVVLLYDRAIETLASAQYALIEGACDGIALALRRAFTDEEIARTQAALRQAVEAKYRLVGGVSVNLKNTLSVVAGYLQLLDFHDQLTLAQQEYVGRSKKAINMAVALINELVELSRAEAGELPIEMDSINLVNFVRDAVANHAHGAVAKKLLVNLDTPPQSALVYTDPNYVRGILDALLHNAVKYSPDAGCITVRLDQREARRLSDPPSWLCVTVQDTGPGIAEPEALFEEVKRADSRKSPMGFRLVICRRIARLLGGDLTLDSSNHRGARFTLWLPTAAAPA